MVSPIRLQRPPPSVSSVSSVVIPRRGVERLAPQRTQRTQRNSRAVANPEVLLPLKEVRVRGFCSSVAAIGRSCESCESADVKARGDVQMVSPSAFAASTLCVLCVLCGDSEERSREACTTEDTEDTEGFESSRKPRGPSPPKGGAGERFLLFSCRHWAFLRVMRKR